MASIERPLLTIAIPTFNRAALLDINLSRIIEAVKGFESYVEIVISDNHSTDNTEAVVLNAQKLYPFKYFKNTENLGFNYNYIKLVDEYANGLFCWVLGDDDLVASNALKEIISILRNHTELGFMLVKFDFKTQTEALKQSSANEIAHSKPAEGEFCSFNELISKAGSPGNLMLTFISSAIFKLDLIKSIDKSRISKESWTTFYNLFPHSFFYALVMKDKPAYMFNTQLITAMVHEKSWDAKLWMLYLKFIPELHEHYLKSGFNNSSLRNQEKLVIRAGIPYLFLNAFSKWKIKVEFLSRYATNKTFYSSVVSVFKRKLFKKPA